MSNEQTYRSNELPGYEFGDPTPPKGFDPNATGFRDAPPGRHLIEVEDYEIAAGKEFKDKDRKTGVSSTYILTQIRPRLRVVGSPNADAIGASIIDFLPVPTPGTVMSTMLANRWSNFVHSLGFELAPGQMVPTPMLEASRAGRNPFEQLKGRRCYCTVVQKLDYQTKQPVLQDNGLPRMEVKFFGYEPVNGKGGNGTPPPATPAPATQPAAPAPAQGEFQL